MKFERKDEESLDSLLKRFKDTLFKYDVVSDVKDNQYYESLSAKKHRENQHKKRIKKIKEKLKREKKLEIKLKKRK